MSKNKSNQTPNDQRSDVKNPNDRDHKANRDNRANQKNPMFNPRQKGTSGKKVDR